MASKLVRFGARQVKPIYSTTPQEARRRVLNLYRAWYRQIPAILLQYDIPLKDADCKSTLRNMFLKNKYVTDIRTIDLLVVKGQMELVETVNIWKQKNHIMRYFKDTTKVEKTNRFSIKVLRGTRIASSERFNRLNEHISNYIDL